MKGKKIKNIIISTGITIFLIAVMVIIFISPLAKYIIEKYDQKILGRTVTLDWAYVNPFTGYVHLRNAKVYETNSDTLFFSSKGISANLSMHKLFSKMIEINDMVLDQPFGVIQQDTAKKLNFNDIIERFTPKDKTRKSKKNPFKFNILNIVINDGIFIYRDLRVPVNYPIKHVNINSPWGFRWDSDSIKSDFNFEAGIGKGSVKGNLKMSYRDLGYRLQTVFTKYDLKFIEQYLKDLINYGVFSASFDADVIATGNFRRAEDLSAKGSLAINDFHFGKNKYEDYASFKNFSVHIYELSPKNKKYDFDSVSLDKPFLKYERYDHLDNLQTIFGRKGTNVSSAKGSRKFNLIFTLADYIVKLSKNFLKSDYKVNRLAIYRGNLLYNDYKLSEKVSLGIRPFYILADSINKNDNRVKVDLRSNLNPYGDIAIHVSVNPKDSSDFDMNYHLQKIPATLFNPYLVNYTSFPLNRGTIEIMGNWRVREGVIHSQNRLLVIDPRVGKRVHKKDIKWIPLPVIMAIVRERANVIDYTIPITGNLKKPKINWEDVIKDALTNVFVKPVTTPYRIRVKQTEKTIEKTIYVKWPMQEAEINRSQERFLNKISDFLEEHPQSSISVYPQTFEEKEKEYILFYEAKKKYFLHVNKKTTKEYTEHDSLNVTNMSVKDSAFFHYVTKCCDDGLSFTIQEKCERYVGKSLINKKYALLLNNRKNTFLNVFKENGTSTQVKMHPNENSIPYNGFSFFKIAYAGDMPEVLQEAYREMEKLNDETPRDRYSDIRKKIKKMFRKK
ncbi:MAG: DUF748 domain-containing protein [Bacteroidia bacterium]|nr:DUF748 domain-containing protein [Bacteroidia bacterium]